MLGNAACWGIALGLIFSESESLADDYRKLLFAMGFILLGILSKAVSVYYKVNVVEIEAEEDENGNLVIKKKSE